MPELLNDTQGGPEEAVTYLAPELQKVLARKRKDVEWKLSSVKEAFQSEVHARIIVSA